MLIILQIRLISSHFIFTSTVSACFCISRVFQVVVFFKQPSIRSPVEGVE